MTDKPKEFAKLYDTELGQILVKLDTDDECKVEVRFWFYPPGLGVCSVAMTAKDDSDSAWDWGESTFANVTEEKATKFVQETIEKLAGFTGEES